MARLTLDSFLLVPMGESDKEYDILYIMLAHALQTEYLHQQEALENAISLIVDMRVDGVLVDLTNDCGWTPAQGRHGDRVLKEFTKNAKDHVLQIFGTDGLHQASATDGKPSGVIIYCLWAMYDEAYSLVGSTVARAGVTQLAIEKKTPPQDLA